MRRIDSDGVHVDLAPDRERVTVRVAGEIDLASAGEMEAPVLELLIRQKLELSGAIEYLGVS